MKSEKEISSVDVVREDLNESEILKAKTIDLLIKIQTPSVVKRCYNYIRYIYLHND